VFTMSCDGGGERGQRVRAAEENIGREGERGSR
jgi:hypothetical protein